MDQKELRELENLCIQECAPWCVASCPVHVDVRAMCAAMARGDFAAGLKAYRKSVPFPGIISRICDHPCERVCKRAEAGSAIGIRDLERAVLAWAPASEPKFMPLRPKNHRLAIVGAGLSGLTASLDLARKGYQIVLFEVKDRLGGSLRDFDEIALPREVIVKDFECVNQTNVEIRFSTVLGKDVSIDDLQTEFETVYLGTGFDSRFQIDMELDPQGLIHANPETFETSRPGVFAGGGLVRGMERRSPIGSISDGRRAAISMDRFVQKVSLTASRENEGQYETRLHTNLKGIDPVPVTPVSDLSVGYSAAEATEEAKRCLHCECMECVKVCEFLSAFQGYPKKYIRQVYNNLSIVMGQRHGNKLINSCSICGLCREVCPENLHMGEVCKAARHTMVAQGKMPRSAHEFALKDMEFSNSDKAALARHQPGLSSSAYLFFPGCQLCGSFPDHVYHTYQYLTERLQGGVGLMLSCCGAPADWAGQSGLFSRVLDTFRAQWIDMGRPKLVLACSSCFAVFKSHLPEASLVSLWEIFDQEGLPESASSLGQGMLAIHDPCTSRHETRIQESVRKIVESLGLETAELPLSGSRTECCGFGGLMYFANRPLADKVVARRINSTDLDMLAYCAVCCDLFRCAGKPTTHIIELLFGDTVKGRDPAKATDHSQKRENRVRLKNRLRREIWEEQGVEPRYFQSIKLNIPENVRTLMARRMILVEDIEQVIRWAVSSGSRLVKKNTGTFLAHYRPGTVTYWVEYSEGEDGLTVHNAYSHRMEVLEEL